jgi:hypothetical protein
MAPVRCGRLSRRQIHHDQRTLVGCPFAFLHGLGLIFATYVPAIAMGWCRYGGKVHMLGGIDMSMNLQGIPYLRLNRNRRGPLTV